MSVLAVWNDLVNDEVASASWTPRSLRTILVPSDDGELRQHGHRV
jgi:hypothetical protein